MEMEIIKWTLNYSHVIKDAVSAVDIIRFGVEWLR
jgi:hypothetical protein